MKLILVLYIMSVANSFEPAKFTLKKDGYRFEPVNAVELLSIFTSVSAIIPCAQLCYQNSQCRTFDFDSSSKQCRLFEGSIDTSNLLPNFSTTIVGSINMNPSMFNLYNASNNQCVNNRFLDSETLSSRCECSINTFWNGSMCLNQRFVNATCENNDSCRTDLWLQCLASRCVVTAAPTCAPQASSSGVLLNITGPSSTNYPTYTCYAYPWIATGSSTTLSFFFRHDPGGWMLDDINFYHGLTQLITNGGFETGNLNGWNYSGICNYHYGQAYSGSSSAKSGSYYYYDRCASIGDTLSQRFLTTAGDTYNISFWLKNYRCCGPTEIANITLL